MVIGIVKNEQQLIRLLIDKPEYLEKIDSEFFISEMGKNLFLTLIELKDKNLPLDENHIVSFGNRKDGSIIVERINSLFKIEYDKNAFEQYYNRLKLDKTQNLIQKNYLSGLIEESSRKGELNIEKIKKLISNIDKDIDIIQDKKQLLYSSIEMINIYSDVLNLRNEGKYFFSSGDSYLDKYLLVGFAPKWITTIFGATGIGKSVWALHLVNGQINRYIPSLYISLEMDLISTMDRLIACRNRIPITHLYPNPYQNETISPYIFEKIEKERNNLGKSKYFYFVEEPSLSLNDIVKIIKDAKKRMGVDYLICTIDLLTMVTDFNKGTGNKADKYEDSMNKLHEIVKKENIHLVGVVQARREADNFKIKKIEDIKKLKPSVGDIKNSGALGERSRIVISTFREKYYAEKSLPDDPETKIMTDRMEIDILKQNMGKLAHLQYLHDGSIAKLCKIKKENNLKKD